MFYRRDAIGKISIAYVSSEVQAHLIFNILASFYCWVTCFC